MNLQRLFVLVFFLGTLSNVYAADRRPDPLETVKVLMAEKKAVLLDVREQDEWDLGHLAGAIHVPTSAINKGMTADELAKSAGKDTVIYLHCKVGKRAMDWRQKTEKHRTRRETTEDGILRLVGRRFPQGQSMMHRGSGRVDQLDHSVRAFVECSPLLRE